MDALLEPAFFKALGDSTRLLLLGCLAKCCRPCSVGEIAECCSVDMSVVSRHLAILERAGFVKAAKKGRTVFYTVMYEPVCRRFRALADAIGECCTSCKGAGTKAGCCAKR
jgi:ArsR family transcriptional regulator, arsenate/arsenite/antimonite-responsive transcriptional repressor